MTIKEALRYGIDKLKQSNIKDPIAKTRMILSFVLSKNKEFLISHDGDILRRK